MFFRITLTRIVRALATVAIAIFIVVALVRTSRNTSSTVELENLTPLENYFLKPFYTTDVLNPHPFEFLIDPGSKVCSDSNVFLLVYVHSAPYHSDRRNMIRNTWGQVNQYDLKVKVVFVMGLPNGNSTIEDQVVAEAALFNDIVQEDFIDTYYNITYKAVAALRWVSRNCPQAKYILKADDDAFVNMFCLLRLLVRMTAAKPSLNTRTIMCNLWKDAVPRTGKWKLDRSVFRFDYYPSFCQGLAFILSRDVIEPLYNATYYTPFLQMDDVYLTGFVVLRIEGLQKVEMNSFYIRNVDLLEQIQGDRWMQYLFSHITKPHEIQDLWNAAKKVTWDS